MSTETNFTKAARQAKRAAIDELLERIRGNKPFWANMPPWEAERHIEGDAGKTQRKLFERDPRPTTGDGCG